MSNSGHATRCVVATACVAILALAGGAAEAQEIGIKAMGAGTGAYQPDAATSPVAVAGGSGFSLGAFLVAPIHEHVEVQVEALFSRRGFDLTGNPDVPTLAAQTVLFAPIDSSFRADYIEIPALLRIPVRRDGAPIHALVGPSAAINVGASLDDRVFPDSSHGDLTGAVRDVDLGLVFGGGVTLWSRFVVEGRYNLGLTGLLSDEAEAAGNLPDVKWRTFGVSAGVIF